MVPPSTSHNDHNHNHDHDHKQDHPSSAGAAGSDWTWGSIWATAATTASAATARVSAVTVKGLETAKAMAEQTAHTVTSNDHVKGLYAGVAPEISKLGTDLSKLATSIADTIAPPISASSGSHGGSHGSSAFAPLVTVWMCAELRDADGLDVLHDFVQSTANEMWVRPFHAGADPKTGMPLMHDVQQHVDASAGSPAESRPADLSTQPIAPGTTLRCGHVCNKAVVNSVKDPDPLIAKSLGEAIEHTEAIIGRLEKLAQANPPPQLPASAHAASPTGAATVVASPLSAYLVIQPFTTQLPPSLLSETPQTHTQYLCTLLCDAGEAGLFSPRAISQSVLTRDTVPSAPLNHVRWETTMHRRVIETSVADLCEELVVALQWS
ncbi:hypothetical protein BC831DRAFT_447514 [Entophlyctis helioformis]|nr:hypothetical protein BC831DRAFT_447514 [Entophlyctis helioformis]